MEMHVKNKCVCMYRCIYRKQKRFQLENLILLTSFTCIKFFEHVWWHGKQMNTILVFKYTSTHTHWLKQLMCCSHCSFFAKMSLLCRFFVWCYFFLVHLFSLYIVFAIAFILFSYCYCFTFVYSIFLFRLASFVNFQCFSKMLILILSLN